MRVEIDSLTASTIDGPPQRLEAPAGEATTIFHYVARFVESTGLTFCLSLLSHRFAGRPAHPVGRGFESHEAGAAGQFPPLAHCPDPWQYCTTVCIVRYVRRSSVRRYSCNAIVDISSRCELAFKYFPQRLRRLRYSRSKAAFPNRQDCDQGMHRPQETIGLHRENRPSKKSTTRLERCPRNRHW